MKTRRQKEVKDIHHTPRTTFQPACVCAWDISRREAATPNSNSSLILPAAWVWGPICFHSKTGTSKHFSVYMT